MKTRFSFAPLLLPIVSAGIFLGCAVNTNRPGGPDGFDPDGSGGLSGTGGDAILPGSGSAFGSGGSAGTGGAYGTGSTAGTGGTWVPGKPTLPDGRGATVPYTEYEAEDMTMTGSLLGPTRSFTQVASEASGRRAVRLDATGESVSFQTTAAANSIVVRYSIPDLGEGNWQTLALYVDGVFRTNLTMTSRYSWTYGDESHFNKPDQNNSGLGVPHHFFDETRALVGDIPEGSTVMLKKDAGNGASHYDIDLVDLELVPGAIAKPSGAISITDCGATPNDQSDDSNAIQSCIDQAQAQKKILYIPEGEFRSLSKGFSTAGITIQGAGMWRSTISGFFARFDCWGGGCKYADFSVFGDTTQRDDNSPETAFSGNGSSNSLLDHIWVEHVKVGYWTGPETNNLVIKNSRFRNLHADAVNFYGGTSNSVVENCHARGTGDDAFAAWSHNTKPVDSGNRFAHNYVQAPWKANCFGIYGGKDMLIEDNVCSDTVQYPGILVARQFDSQPFSGTNTFERNSLIRAGGFTYGSEHGAFKLHADQETLQHIVVKDLDVFEATYSAIHVQGTKEINSVWFDGVKVTSPGTSVFYLNWGAVGAMDAANVTATSAPAGAVDASSGKFKILRGTGNTGW